MGLLLSALVPLLYYLIQYDSIDFESPMFPRIAPFLSVLFFSIAVLCFVYAFVSIISGKRLLQYQNSGRSRQDGRFLMGVVLYEDLFRDLSYWQAYWEKLKQTLLSQKRDTKPLRRKKPRSPQTKPPPFRPRRRR
ncbi:MAG: hypothetical protein ACXADY_17155 [Candidatus Hodarchaeales archaeon]